jgi:2'-5' RNA ligase
MVRVFLAIKVGETNEITEFVKELKHTGIDAKFVEPENLHINIKFFGEVERDKLNRILQSLESIEFNPFSVKLKSVGVFPSESYPRVIWIGVNSPELKKLFEVVENELSKMGIPREVREFKPHVTICRLRSQANKNMLINKLNKFKSKFFGDILVNEVILFESKLSPRGPTYIPIKRFRLIK